MEAWNGRTDGRDATLIAVS